MIKAQRQRGGVILTGEFTEKQWASGYLQKIGWVNVASIPNVSVIEAVTGRQNVNTALHEQSVAKDQEISELKARIDSLQKENASLAENQKKSPGRKPLPA